VYSVGACFYSRVPNCFFGLGSAFLGTCCVVWVLRVSHSHPCHSSHSSHVLVVIVFPSHGLVLVVTPSRDHRKWFLDHHLHMFTILFIAHSTCWTRNQNLSQNEPLLVPAISSSMGASIPSHIQTLGDESDSFSRPRDIIEKQDRNHYFVRKRIS
jgi:hypothetical protein